MTNKLRIDLAHEFLDGAESYRIISISNCSRLAGPQLRTLDRSGEYRWVILSPRGKIRASHGFSPLFCEWILTEEAAIVSSKVFYESIFVPFSKDISILEIQRRTSADNFSCIFKTQLDSSYFKNTSLSDLKKRSGMELRRILTNGSDDSRVNLLVVSEGYTQAEKEKFWFDAIRYQNTIFSSTPFQQRAKEFNLNALFVPSIDSGITDPGSSTKKDTAFSCSFNSLNLERYILPNDMPALYDTISGYPWDSLTLLCNTKKYGGSGLFGQYSCVSADASDFQYIAIHELGHAFAGLADEYYSSSVPYLKTSQPSFWEANVDTLQSEKGLKWQSLISSSTAIPTPWDKEKYDSFTQDYYRLLAITDGQNHPDVKQEKERINDALRALLANQAIAGTVGAFEGAAYYTKGAYRPEIDCIMFSKESKQFCKVCQTEIDRIIDLIKSGQ